jgi:tetratricopeptide (TPR) repeat protein
LPAATPEWTRANDLYLRTEYQQSLAVLQAAPRKDAAALQLTGQNFFMLGEYKKASEAFEKAAALDPNNAKLIHWLGRAYGRRAETSNPFMAPGLASKTRQMLRKPWSLIRPTKMRWGICSISISMHRDFWVEECTKRKCWRS